MDKATDTNPAGDQECAKDDALERCKEDLEKLLNSHIKEYEKLLDDFKETSAEKDRINRNIAPWGVRAMGTAVTLITTASVFCILGGQVMNKDIELPRLGALLFLSLLWCVMCIGAGLLTRRLR